MPESNLDSRLLELEEAVELLRARNRYVEGAKGWETSGTRTFAIAGLTYLSMCLLLTVIGLQEIWLHALVPSCGYLLSTLSRPLVKGWWLRRYHGGKKPPKSGA